MQLWNGKVKGILLVALMNGLVGGLSTHLAIMVYRKYGWSVMGSSAVIMAVLLIAVSPVAWMILQKYYKDP